MLRNKIIIVITSFYIFYLGVLPVVLTNTANVVCRNLSSNSNYDIELKNPRVKLSVLPTVKIYADEISFKTKTDINEAEIKNIAVKLRLLPLLSGRLHVNYIDIESLKASSGLKENVQLDKDFFEQLEHTKVKCNSLKINEFETYLYQKDVKEPIAFIGSNFAFQKKNRYVRFKMDSVLKAGEKVSKANLNLFLPKNNDIRKTIFDVEVSNLDIAPFGVYFKHYLPDSLKELQGVVNVHANKDELVTELIGCKALMKTPSDSMIFPDTLNIRSKFKIKKQYINFDKVKINAPNIDISFDGRIYDYFGKAMPTLDLNFQINPTKVEKVISMLPPFKVEEIDIYKLKKYKFFGDCIGNFSVKGRLPEPDINGDIFVNNGILTKPIPNTKQGATIKLELTGKYINFDVFVPAGGTEKVWVKGGQELYNVKYADMTIKSTKTVDLHVAETVVNPLHEILNFIIGPVPIMDIYGKGNIDINVKGNRKNPHVWGVFNALDSTVSFIEIPDLKLTNADAKLTFNDQDAVFVTKRGFVNGQDFKLVGTCNLFGKFDFDAASKSQSTAELYKAIQTATLIPDIKAMIPNLTNISGTTDLNLKIYGAVKVIEDLQFNKNTFAKGEISIKNNSFTFQDMKVDNANGDIKFDTNNAEGDIFAQIGNSPLSIKAKVKNDIGDIILNMPKLDPNFLIEDKTLRSNNLLPIVNVSARYKGNTKEIEYNKLSLAAKILSSAHNSAIKYSSGALVLNNGKINIKDMRGYINNPQNLFHIDLRIDNAFTQSPDANGTVTLKTPDLSAYNDILRSCILPDSLKFIKDFRFEKGKLDFNGKISNNKLNAYTDLSGISLIYLPLELPVEIINGSVQARNNNLKLNKINMLADKMPILVDGEVRDITGKQNFNLYLNSKPQQDFIEKYINKNRIYPVKIKGDIVYWVRAKGTPNNFDLKSNVNLSKDSSIYHYGATIGDIENAIDLDFDSKVLNKNNLKIKDFSYNKLIDSQSGRHTRLEMLKVWGGAEILKDDLMFRDLHVKTNNPADARIFNIIFRKPNIKQGQFTSDLKINGKLSNPKIIGDFHIFETNIPFLDTTMKNIALVFKDRNIEISSKGEIMGNDVTFQGTLKNKLTTPYNLEKAHFYTKDLNLNNVVDMIKISQVDKNPTLESFEVFDINSVVFNNLKLKADNIKLRNINATNFEATANLNDKGLLDINNFNFNIAQGTLNGKYKYNLKNNDMSLNLNAKEINANDITWALFDLKNQIYGDMTGTVSLSCNGANFHNCMQTLNGTSAFNVKDGKMPKLGSLEYLLKAGNLLKGGITSLSINGVIDIITPLKTGEFSDIYGNIRIKDGVARNIEIVTKGKDLSLYIGGTYNFSTSIADMEVLGILSKKISTMFGPIGNLSINTLFNVIPGVDLSGNNILLDKINKIPGIELSNKNFRKFIAEIKGNINGDDYVTSFQWIN